jgi:hypothetical protein
VFAGLPHASAATTSWPGADPVRPRAQKKGTVGVYVGWNGPDYAYQTRKLFTAQAASKSLPAITLPDAAVITGAGGTDLAKRSVHLENLHGDLVGSVTADATGAFRFEVVPGSYRLAVPADGTHLEWRSPTRVTATAGAPHAVRVQRVLGATLTGVVTSGGSPAAGVAVRAGSRTTTTTADGSWSISGVPLGITRVRFGVVGDTSAKRGVVPLTRSVSGLGSGRTTRVNASVVQGGLITGTFDSAPGADSYIFAVTRTSPYGALVTEDYRAASGTTSKNTLVASGLAAGTYDVRAADLEGARYAERIVHLKAGATVRLGVLKPTKRTVSLQGSVSGASGGEVVAVAKNETGFGAASAAGGRYAMFGLLPGSYRLYYAAPNRLASSVTLGLHRDTTRNLTAGTALGKVSGVVYAGYARTDGVDLQDSASGTGAALFNDRPLDASADVDGLQGAGAPGLHRIVDVTPRADPFQAFSPYWYGWPGGSITLIAGGTTKLGAVTLTLEGAPGVSAAPATAPGASSTSSPVGTSIP